MKDVFEIRRRPTLPYGDRIGPPALKEALLSQALADLAGKAKVEDPLGRHRLRRFDALGGNRDHLPLQFFIYNAG